MLAGLEGGSRLLFLDGGGIKGLSQIETLIQLEEATGRKVTELFDWIVGTSTGGVIALAVVYGRLRYYLSLTKSPRNITCTPELSNWFCLLFILSFCC